MNYFILISISFFLGIIVALFLVFVCGKKRIKEKLNIYKGKGKRFLKNTTNHSSIFFLLIILYIIFKFLGYEEEMLPEIIGTGLSVFIINFILEEREYNKEKDIKKLLNFKMKKICSISKDMLLKYIDFNDYDINNISKDLLVNILSKQDLFHETIIHYDIQDTGSVVKKQIPKIDYPFFIAKELRPILMELTSNYGQYLEYEQIMAIIELEEILNKKIFNSRISLVEGIEEQPLDVYKEALADSLDKFNGIISKLQVRS